MIIYISVEGETEIDFVKRVLYPYLEKAGIFVIPIKLHKKGGISSFEKAKREINKLLLRKDCYVTTMYDYYGLPSTFIGDKISNSNKTPLDKVLAIEANMDTTIASKRFKSYIQLHEFEALLFSDESGNAWENNFYEAKHQAPLKQIKAIIKAFPNPEDINNSRHTAPSKRIDALFKKSFIKTLHGIYIAEEIGIHQMLQKCPHFKNWVDWMLSLKEE